MGAACSIQYPGQFGHDIEEVAHQADVCDFEYGRFLVLVDRDNRACVLDPRQVLDSPGDADRNLEVRRYNPPGLAYLHLVRHVTGIDSGA